MLTISILRKARPQNSAWSKLPAPTSLLFQGRPPFATPCGLLQHLYSTSQPVAASLPSSKQYQYLPVRTHHLNANSRHTFCKPKVCMQASILLRFATSQAIPFHVLTQHHTPLRMATSLCRLLAFLLCPQASHPISSSGLETAQTDSRHQQQVCQMCSLCMQPQSSLLKSACPKSDRCLYCHMLQSTLHRMGPS